MEKLLIPQLIKIVCMTTFAILPDTSYWDITFDGTNLSNVFLFVETF